MSTYSPGVLLAWQIAAAEAAAGTFEFIEPEHILIGLCKVSDGLTPAIAKWLEQHSGNLEQLRNEVGVLEQLFSTFSLDRVKLRRLMRSLIGKGEYVNHERRTVHRSVRCKHLFDRASETAQAWRAAETNCLHLLGALLRDPGAEIISAFSQLNIEVGGLRKAVVEFQSEVVEPQSQVVEPQGGGF